jgi:micrococcal nuclease
MTNQRRIKLFLSLFASVMAVILLVRQGPRVAPASAVPSSSASSSSASAEYSTTTPAVVANALVVRAVDGDTLVVRVDGETQDARVRLLGVNTPESVDPRRPVQCFGKEASHFTASIVGGKRVRLESDPEADERDKYDRLLRNVILEDGTDFNAKLVADGYAYAYVSLPMNKQRKAELRRLQDEARLAERGLWSPKTCAGLK